MLKQIVGVILIVASISLPAHAQPRNDSPRPDVAAFAASVLSDGVTSVESDLVRLIKSKSQATPEAAALIDFQIDLRVIHRWLLQQAITERDADNRVNDH